MQRVIKKDIQSPDLTQTKVTPRTRPAHEAGHDGQLKNFDTEKKYVLCDSNDKNPMGYQYYQSIGYDFELCVKDGVRINLGSKPIEGKPLEWRGMVLMSCSKERADEIFRVGPTGNTGQEYFNKLMQRIQSNPTNKKPHEIIPGLTEKYDINDPDDDLANGTFR